VNLEKNLELTVAIGDKQLDAFGFLPLAMHSKPKLQANEEHSML